ncbi:MAG: plastocyanin/azurin family copper-binding protein [Actinomycetota bacterium]
MRWIAVFVALGFTATACGASPDHRGMSNMSESSGGGRAIAIATTDALRFEPASITAKAGETVTFVVTNNGTLAHEFAIGSKEYHDEMSKMTDHMAHGSSSMGGAVVAVPAGQTAKLTYTMPDSAPTIACHVDKHDVAGMIGSVTYS